MRRLIHVTVAAVLVLGTAGIAEADSKAKLSGDTKATSVSGYSGGYQKLAPGEGDYQGLYAIEWAENADRAVDFTAYSKHVNTYSKNNASVDICGIGGKPGCPGGNKKKVSLAGDPDFVYKVQVCTTDKKKTANNRLKGIRLWSRVVERSGAKVTLKTQATYQEAKHTNCKKWRTAVQCGDNKIATGIRVHHGGKGGTGIALLCRKVITK